MKSYTHFTLDERICLQKLFSEGLSMRKIASILGRSPSTISREIKRNWSKKKKHYHAWGSKRQVHLPKKKQSQKESFADRQRNVQIYSRSVIKVLVT